MILERAAFHYDHKIDYCADTSVKFGEVIIICQYYYKALKYSSESTGLCCVRGKVKFPQLVPPPDPQGHYFLGWEVTLNTSWLTWRPVKIITDNSDETIVFGNTEMNNDSLHAV